MSKTEINFLHKTGNTFRKMAKYIMFQLSGKVCYEWLVVGVAVCPLTGSTAARAQTEKYK